MYIYLFIFKYRNKHIVIIVKPACPFREIQLMGRASKPKSDRIHCYQAEIALFPLLQIVIDVIVFVIVIATMFIPSKPPCEQTFKNPETKVLLSAARKEMINPAQFSRSSLLILSSRRFVVKLNFDMMRNIKQAYLRACSSFSLNCFRTNVKTLVT